LRLSEVVAGAGFEPESPSYSETTQSAQNSAKSTQDNTLPGSPSRASEQNPAFPEQSTTTSERSQVVPRVYQNQSLPSDLAQVIDAWDHLPQVVKAGILAMVAVAESGQS
jgi:hypothetical protein